MLRPVELPIVGQASGVSLVSLANTFRLRGVFRQVFTRVSLTSTGGVRRQTVYVTSTRSEANGSDSNVTGAQPLTPEVSLASCANSKKSSVVVGVVSTKKLTSVPV